MQAGQKLAAAEEPMADAGQVVAGLESLEATPWPDDLLSRRALALLPDAYYRLCQQGDDAS